MDLSDLRGKIDGLDDEIVKLFCERMSVCAEIARYKARHRLGVHDPRREEQKLTEIMEKADEELREYLGGLYARIFELSRQYQEQCLKSGAGRDAGSARDRHGAMDIHDARGARGAKRARGAGKFGLLGQKLSHSFSPLIHSMLADYEYWLFEKKPEEVAEFLKHGDYDGLNVTIPYKKTVLPYCATLSDTAARTGSVNTIVRQPDGRLHGDNTDYYGFSCLLDKAGADVKGKKAVVLGDGGAAATVRAVLGDRGAGEIVTIPRAGILPQGNRDMYVEVRADAQILVNATPVGMYPENGPSPVDLRDFPSLEFVLDLISNPIKTSLVIQAEDLGIPSSGGLCMLIAQAKRSCELFTGKTGHGYLSYAKRDGEPYPVLFKSIALIGMPGCGKTTVGRRLAEVTGRGFYDTDEIIASRAGKSIESIFDEDGEDVFRSLETTVLTEVSKECGCVIATGGGIIKNENNRKLLRQNSIVVFLDCEPGSLPVDGRPLSRLQGVELLYNERLPLYMEWCEHRITACGGVEQTAAAVLEKLGIGFAE